MIWKRLVRTALVVLFFFGEIAITLSDKAEENSLINTENISFALRLDNDDTEFTDEQSIDLLFENFLEKYNIQGASVAVTHKEKLVYAKGFGLANTETGEKVQPGHLFRIASVSKLITATGIMKLVEEGELSLEDRVFGPDGLLNDPKFLKYEDIRVEEIRVKNLLNHTPGWSRHKGDPIFNSLYVAHKFKLPAPAKLDDIIVYQLGKPLSFDPGTVYSYSNLGYAILGKIIELKSGLPYEDYIVLNILKPHGIHDMHIGHSLYHEKFPNEVHYYEPAGSSLTQSFDGSGKMVKKSYGGNNMDLLGAAGGWVASAPELARFISAIDGYSVVDDVLDSTLTMNMADPEIAGKGLFGWRGADRHGTWWRTGTLSGSTALVMRFENGENWVVLLNSSAYKRIRIHNKLSRTIFAASYRVKNWPSYDLFANAHSGSPTSIGDIPAVNPEL